MVKAYCTEYGIAYTETTLVQSYRHILAYPTAVGHSARSDIFACPLVQQYRV